MKFTCSKETLLSVLSQISKAIAVKPASPVLGGIYLKVADNSLELHANNYSLGMSAKITVNALENGEVVVIGKKFLDVVRAMPNSDAIVFTYDENENCFEIACGRSSYSIATFNVEDFPKVTKKDAENSFDIKANILRSLIKKTVWACVQDESHPLYSGCLLDTNDDSITVVGTNMHRVSIATDKLLQKPAEPLRFVVPVDSLRSIAEMLPDDDDLNITIDYTGKNVAFTIENIFLTARIIEGKFPEYQKTIPNSSATVVIADVEELKAALERISIISKEDTNKRVAFEFSQDGTKIYATTSEIGSGTENLRSDVSGPDLNISFNYSYIIDALKVLKNGNCRMAFNGIYDALDLRSQNDENYIYIVTPVRA